MALTPRRDLRTGRSVWQARRLPALGLQRLTRALSTEVVVVGAGISGALMADALTDAGHDVVVVDRRHPVSGSTPASTALLQYDIDLPLIHLAERIGADKARRIWRRSRLALDGLRERTRHLRIDAECQNRDSLYLEGNVLNAGELQREAEARRHAGFEVTFLPAAQVKARFGIAGRAGILSYDNLSADPRRLAAGFLKVAVGRGATLYSPVNVTGCTSTRDGVRLTTGDGVAIRARAVVFATGYELAKGVPRRGHTVNSTWALATRPQRSTLWPEGCFIWEAADPYLYLRVGPDRRIICGGEDEPFADAPSRDALLPAKTAVLQAKLAKLLPWVDTRVDYAWCGTFGGSTTGTPSIGAVPGQRHRYAVLGYGGNGITFSALAAQLITSQIGGRRDPDSALFSFGRRRR